MPNEIDLRDYIDILVRRWKFVIALPILAAMTAAIVSFAVKPVYQATATIALAPATVSVSLANQLPPYYLMVDSPRNLPVAYTPTYYIAMLRGADVVTAAQSRSSIVIAGDGGDRSLIHITARGDDAKTAAADANAYAQAGVNRLAQLLVPTGAQVAAAKQRLDAAQQAFDKFLLDNKIVDYDPAVPPELAPDNCKELTTLSHARDLAESIYLDFARDFAKTSILAETSYRPTVIPATVPSAPVSPQLAQNILIGGAFGLLIGVLGAFILELLRRPAR